MNFISTIPALTAMFFCLSQGRDSLEHLNGVEYAGYIICDGKILNAEGESAAEFVAQKFPKEYCDNKRKVSEMLAKGEIMEESPLDELEGPDSGLDWTDAWYWGQLVESDDGYAHITLPVRNEKDEPAGFVIPCVYCNGVRVYYTTLGGIKTGPGCVFRMNGGKLPANEVCMGLAKILLAAYHGEQVSLPRNMQELERREKLHQQVELRKKFSDQHWLNHEWQWSGYLGNPDETMEAMGVAPLVKPGRVPNVNYRAQGFKELRKQLETLIAKQSGAVVHLHKCVDNGEIVEWDFCLGDKSRVHVSMANAYSSTQAMKMMYTYPERFFDDNFGGLSREIGLDHKYNCEQLPDMLEFAEGVAGEHTIRMRQLIGEDGLPVKGSEKRSIYFTRGNTAVGVFTDNPAFNVLPIARAIDKLLVEGMRKAGEPLTKEQDYLKEDKGKKQK